MTTRLYLDDAYRREFDASVVACAGGAVALSATGFHPGGGGQPHDRGQLVVGGETLALTAVREDDAGAIWHDVGRELAIGAEVHGVIDWPFRYALMRHHALLHIVNTVAQHELGGVITGAQIGPERSRIDFKLADFSRERIGDFEARVNDVIARDLPLRASIISEEEYRRRPELIRTLNVLPPVVDGRVRIVGIDGFDEQACGGTHVHSTREIGRARVAKFDNKGRDNKRFYWTLDSLT
ncbi:MAG: alanyl-tRNA editing protein [Polyangia bacterium]